MKAAKKILGVILALVLLMGIACAEGLLITTGSNGSSFVQKITVTDSNNFNVTVCDANIKGNENNIAVSIDGVSLAVTSSSSAASWIFLVDTSTVSTEAWSTAPVIKTLESLINNMGDLDNGLICNPSTMTEGRTLSSKGELKNLDDKAMMEKDSSNPASFPDAVGKALDYLRQNPSTKGHTNLVIISNGSPKGETAETINALLQKVKSAESTVYTVAYTDGNTKEDVLRAYGGLAGASKGGKDIVKKASAKPNNYTEMVKEISDNEKLFRTVSVNIPEPTPLTSAKILKVSVNGIQPSEISHEIPLAVSSALSVKTESEKSWIEEHLMLVIIAGGALLVVIAGVVIILMVVRKKKNNIVEPDDALPPPPISREVRVTLTREEDGEQFSAVTQGGICVVGRSSDADIPLPDAKMKISREHMQLSYENGIVMLADLGSRNHTFVNGIMVSRKTVMQQGDIIRMGDSEFRISWRQL